MARRLVEVKDVYKSFGEQVVLRGVSLDVMETENLVIFGKSGTGKSVLLKCMVGLLVPDKGTIFIDGVDVLNLPLNKMNELRKNISFLFQSAALYDSMSVRENLSFPLIRNFKFTQKEITAKVERALEMVSLSGAIDKMPSELSGGMRKRVGLARAIITEPQLMLYDEPTTGLDPITTKEISKLIRDLQQELKMTSIAVTHDLICAQIIADRAVVLNNGLILFEGSLQTLTGIDDPFMKNFFSPDYIEEEHG
ncbi:MAG: ABC transporter ATP-binding protein [Ignavibacteriales bacterium]|nr:MAG: ABC transporter ATP-binding protein [Ignavibacteriaceae bacterium]MBW7873831.1 ABC transporter ATP-binding protein [Ignavibacteria bacterium]MCZ2144168.1 ABC transporter ATP-binding protein [Ignavibacteriales bacterium]OQY77585.1 MAG: ABC transporter ATP-binding protein [Ignavibacteriales bacterium UTCHB3]MBV6445807.1 putative ribonucleotide transport ATP-binding protein mkl [Ignavibacteriaceae bacterium]